MLSRLKQYFWIALGIFLFYYLLSHHLIFTDIKTIDILKKNELTLKYTFLSIANVSPREVLRIDELRDAGIGDILLKRGKVSQSRLDQITKRIDNE